MWSSEEGNRPWFTQIELDPTNKGKIILTCKCKQLPTADFKAGITLERDDQGNVWVRFKEEKEQLPLPSDGILDIAKALIDFPPKCTLRIIIPYTRTANHKSLN